MNRFVVTIATRGPLPTETAALLDAPDVDALPFSPERHLRWSDPTGRVQYAGWEQGPEPHADVGDDGLVAWAGTPRPRRDVWPPRRRIVDALRETDDAELCDAHVVVRLAITGDGSISSDPFGLHPLYLAETDTVTVIGNRADLVAEVAARSEGRAPTRDLDGGAWLAFAGYHVGDVTGFDGVRVLAHDTDVRIGDARVRLLSPDPLYGVDPEADELDADLAADELFADIEAALRHAIARSPVPAHVELTGGKDSRLVLAVALEAGLADQVRFSTYGAPGLPDMEVARALADQFGLDHVDTTAEHYAGAAAFTTEERYRRHVHRACGASPCSDGNEPVARDHWVVSAHLGELYRTASASHAENPARDWDSATRRFLAGRRFGELGIVRPSVADELRERATDFALAVRNRVRGPEELGQTYNLRCRFPRWQGPLVDHHEHRVLAVASPAAVRSAFATGTARDHEAIHHRLIERASPDLAAAPFANDRWRGEVATAVPLVGAKSARQVRATDTEADHRRVLHELLVENPDNPVFAVVDPAGMRDAIDRLESLPSMLRMQLLGATAAVIWHGGMALPSRPGGLPSRP